MAVRNDAVSPFTSTPCALLPVVHYWGNVMESFCSLRKEWRSFYVVDYINEVLEKAALNVCIIFVSPQICHCVSTLLKCKIIYCRRVPTFISYTFTHRYDRLYRFVFPLDEGKVLESAIFINIL